MLRLGFGSWVWVLGFVIGVEFLDSGFVFLFWGLVFGCWVCVLGFGFGFWFDL